MVLPAELLQVNYAAELRSFLSKYFGQITVLTFRGLAFDGIQQEVVLVLADRNQSSKTGIEVLELNDATELLSYDPLSFGINGFKSVDHDTEKWTKYYLSQEEIDLIRALRLDKRLTRLGDVATVDIGVVTGMNEVFVLKCSQILCGMRKFTCPLVGRSGHLKGILFTKEDWEDNASANLPAHLLSIPDTPRTRLPADMDRYLRRAEHKKLNAGYKCSIRKLWYVVPSVYVPDGFLLRQIHAYPKLIVNDARATCTDTIHRVRFSKDVDGRRIAAAFMNSLTFAFSEILGRSYGGGVLELEPNEADNLPLPVLNAENLDIEKIDRLVRASEIHEVLEENDRILLVNGLGLTEIQVRTLGNIWKKLQTRRTGRRNGRRTIACEAGDFHTFQSKQPARTAKRPLYAT
jgi:adenine-specific DNA-methyltransferase